MYADVDEIGQVQSAESFNRRLQMGGRPNTEEIIFLSLPGKGLNYTKDSILLVRRIRVEVFVAKKRKKIGMPG